MVMSDMGTTHIVGEDKSITSRLEEVLEFFLFSNWDLRFGRFMCLVFLGLS